MGGFDFWGWWVCTFRTKGVLSDGVLWRDVDQRANTFLIF